MGEYFISGYTGFCPDIADHIGYNYEKATRKIIKNHPHVRTRLAAVLHPEGNGDCRCYCPPVPEYEGCREAPLIQRKREKEDRRCQYPVPEYPPGYKGGPMRDVVWRSCYGDGRNAQCPEQPYNLECNEWNSPCISKHCNEEYQPCIRRQSCNCCDQIMMAPEILCAPAILQMNQELPGACCDSCAKGGPCIGDSKSEPRACSSAKKVCSCFPDKDDRDSSGKKCARIMFQPFQITEFRKGGVVPNYMGHIPGLQNSFGEPYSIAACRLLRNHFDELSRRAS